MTDLEMLLAKQAIREVYDVYALYSDTDRQERYAEIFTEDIHLKVYIAGGLAMELNGVDEIVKSFRAFTANVKTQYHFNGQLLIDFVSDDEATAIGYSKAHLVSEDAGQDIILESGLRYNDRYVRREGKWYLASRETHFLTSDKRILGR